MNPADKLTAHFRIPPPVLSALTKLKIETVGELLYYFPSKYGAQGATKSINALTHGDFATVYGRIISSETKKAWKKNIPMAEVVIEDDTGRLRATWFHQAYLAKKLRMGSIVRMSGTVGGKQANALYMANPEFEEVPSLPEGGGDRLFDTAALALTPMYPERRGISSLWIQHHIKRILQTGVQERMDDPIAKDVLVRYHLPSLANAVLYIHMPRNEREAEAARKRFAFEEVYFLQIERLRLRENYRSESAWNIIADKKELSEFEERFTFPLTSAQKRAVLDIESDLKETHPMLRLLEGDVGSGKTAVAAMSAFAVVSSNASRKASETLQVAYMSPTEILATQHFHSFIKYFKHLDIPIALLTGSLALKYPSKTISGSPTSVPRPQLLKWIEEGVIPIVFGTHALIQKKVIFKNLAYVIIDEQHRFGIEQRGKLARKGAIQMPHLLSMTATPIPRTLALTIHGDLDITLLDELPQGRKKIETKIVSPNMRAAVYEAIRTELRKDRQAFVICPRVFEPDPDKEDALIAKSVTAEAIRLKDNIFPEYRIASLHGKATPKEKEETMRKFLEHETDILVATSVVEVGVNVPNATVILIEGAERFGLAQLHQLRGRVQRSEHPPFCYLATETSSKKSMERLRALVSAKNGFELAEMDLSLRGAGELAGGKQWGVSDIAMDAIKNLRLVEAARKEAIEYVKQLPSSKSEKTKRKLVHME
ncbi:MAG: ATP-dependent DNA helicase RecG [Candidatus Vogelbacteria bacterium CG10_big_fil_rev_8_21_14_0_10_45_14]|uniref:ATP-dependent DNA helicase RecG n=1 Tax=Candidatus Vogelbacteria bacterium CG10_big_fil_rev_8_21_14_0_10_45_14 TaxID=1975042 RepID=A0A2H0RIE1_9BACT|nr:MAG: ATP-dependent DNA helicase RecG [Candidatus Vogelbacteria bacterium CG10_big_fil_rev_8_21_14_0_10_45_14]